MTQPLVVHERADLEGALAPLRAGGTALVPTMGALHDGHRALMRRARELAPTVVVTVFVNPLQFGANEDLDRYPRTLPADVAACAEEGVAIVWAPSDDVVYPERPRVTVHAGAMGDRLCGASRPGHFDGVLTVVAKLFNTIRPDVAVFGEKDAQQLVLIRRMVRDLDLPLEVVGHPTVREADGLALSSRNAYLSDAERGSALAISHAIAAGTAIAGAGPEAVVAAARAVLDAEPGLRTDYLELVDPDTLDTLAGSGPGLLAIAAFAGATRLIDNGSLLVGNPPVARTPEEP